MSIHKLQLPWATGVEGRPAVWAIIFLIASAAFLASPGVQSEPFQFGLTVFGGVLMLLGAGIGTREALEHLRTRYLTAVASRMVAREVDPGFITGRGGLVTFSNSAAIARFGPINGQLPTKGLRALLANPDALLRRLVAQVEIDGHGSEDIVTSSGHHKITVHQLGPAVLLWRLSELAEGEKLANRTMTALPKIYADATGAITVVNEAFVQFYGERPRQLAEVFGELVLRTGQRLQIRTTKGRQPVIVAQMEGQGGVQEIIVLPVPQTSAGETGQSTEWDAIEDLPVPLIKMGEAGDILASNREARLLLKISDTSGQAFGDLLHGLGRPIKDWLREAIEGRGGHFSQFLRGRGDNQETFVQVTLSCAGPPGERHLIAVLNDVTELKTLEAQFVQSQKMQAIGQLAGGVAHDFNNLLTAISGHCDLLLLRHDEGDQNYSDLVQIHQNANRAASLVGQLLAFSRKQNLQPEIIDLRDTLSDLTHLLNRLVGEKVSLSLNHDPALAQIKADKRQLEQVLMNLVVNARDAMPNGGKIRVVTQNLNLKTGMVRDRAVVPPGEYVVVKVIDEGHGIAPDKLPKIFEPFYTTKRTGEGTGLGLSTAYGIVKQTGGYIFAESAVGQGTKFSLLFPSYDLPVAEPLPLPIAAPEPAGGKADGVVLLVEDEAPVRAFASRALRLRGYTVLEADCAEAALDLLNDPQLAVDIFVTDVIMPGLDGPTWVRQALKDRPRTKVVFVSGYAEDAFGEDRARIPNSVFLPKPFSLNALTSTVYTQLQGELDTAQAALSS